MSEELRLRDVFQAGLPDFLKRHSLPLFLRKAAAAITVCRTAVLGGHIEACPNGHVQKAWYNSCRHRACPLCAYAKLQAWLDKKRQLLLPCDHFHLTFTMAHDLLPLWRNNRDLIANLLFQAVRDTLFLLLRDPQWMGGLPGLVLNLHTWSRSLALHPHIHALITGGGIGPDGTWKPARKREHLISMEVIRPIFTAKMRDALWRCLDQGKLRLPPDMPPGRAHRLIRQATRKPWVVNRKPRYQHGKGVLIYLARYIRGGPIKDRRLLGLDRETVTLQVSRRGEELRTVTLTIDEFLKRILAHVPSPGFRVVRNYGLYHHAHR